jgi:tRNA-splicing ligase RtcB
VTGPVIARWLAGPAGAEVEAALARVAGTPDVVRMAVMPDVHLAGEFCVGTVVATRRSLFPRAVGGDIGCGMASVRVAGDSAWLHDEREARRLLRGLALLVPVHRHGAHTAPQALPEPLVDAPLSDPACEKRKARTARVQLGTLGSGNHVLEVQADEEQGLWVTVHTGSRGIGQAITEAALARAAPGPTGVAGFAAASADGEAYGRDVDWARAYARANRRAILDAVAELLAAMHRCTLDWPTLLDCDHNHVSREAHGGELLWVHRKGALSARAGEPGIVPGSMGAATYHTTGRGCAAALCSSSHGAGRALPRGAARAAIGVQRLRREMRGVMFDRRLEDALRDEAPSATRTSVG